MLYDMLEICLLLLISLALRRVGLPSVGWPAWRWIADVMSVYCYWCHGAVIRWPPLLRSKASPLVPVRAEGGGLFVDQRYLWANRYLVPRSPSLSWQSLR